MNLIQIIRREIKYLHWILPKNVEIISFAPNFYPVFSWRGFGFKKSKNVPYSRSLVFVRNDCLLIRIEFVHKLSQEEWFENKKKTK